MGNTHGETRSWAQIVAIVRATLLKKLTMEGEVSDENLYRYWRVFHFKASRSSWGRGSEEYCYEKFVQFKSVASSSNKAFIATPSDQQLLEDTSLQVIHPTDLEQMESVIELSSQSHEKPPVHSNLGVITLSIMPIKPCAEDDGIGALQDMLMPGIVNNLKCM